MPLARSSVLRLAAAMAALFAAALIVAFAAAYWLIARDLEARARAEIEVDARSLEEAYARGGPDRLADAVRAHAAEQPDVLYFYSGRESRTIGNVVFERTFIGWQTVPQEVLAGPSPAGRSARYLALGVPVGDGTLILARGTDAVEDAKAIFTGAMFWGLGIAVALAGAGTIAVARRSEARIAGIAATLDRVAAGDLERRVPEAGAGDDLGRVAQAINLMLDRLAANVASLRQVSADIAHDLATPIQRLRATLEALKRSGGQGQEAVVEEAIGRADEIARTFEALLRIAQVEGGSPRARFRAVDMVELAEAVADAFQPAVEDAGHRFVAVIPEGARPEVRGDRDLLAQMLSNLLTNAMRHAPPPAEIGLRLAAEGGQVELVVSDTGPGIPPEERERVFRRLYRLERSRTTEGSGLGLSMVAAVVELHGGAVRLEDNAPGLRAVVRLPRLA